MEQATPAPVIAIVLAAGHGVRFDADNPKQLIKLEGKPVVAWSIDAFQRNERVSDIVIVVNERVRPAMEQLVEDYNFTKVRAIINGGAERVDSTETALAMLADHNVPANAKLLFHDSVRPFVSQRMIDGCIDTLGEFSAATVACPSTDTILMSQDLGDRKVIKSVPNRKECFRVQTPQAFRFETIRHAYELAALDDGFQPTDDTRAVVEYLPDIPVAIVSGSPTNLKITTQDDLPLAQLIAHNLKK